MICEGAEVRFSSAAEDLPDTLAPVKQTTKTATRIEKIPPADNVFNMSRQYGVAKQWQGRSEKPLKDCIMVNTY